MLRANKTIVRTMAAQRPSSPEDERSEWEQSFSVIPDFDFSEFDSEIQSDPKHFEAPDLSFENVADAD